MIFNLLRKKHFYAGLLIGLFLINVVGCRVLRQKFVRKKTAEEETPVYVNFKDYSQAPPKRIYNDYYYFTSGWLSEIVSGLEDNFNYKRQSYAIDEVVANLGKIRNMLSDSGKEAIAPLIAKAKKVQKKLAPNLTNLERRFLLQEVEMLKIRFDRKFDYGSVEKWLN
jgi:hypothetical protein